MRLRGAAQGCRQATAVRFSMFLSDWANDRGESVPDRDMVNISRVFSGGYAVPPRTARARCTRPLLPQAPTSHRMKIATIVGARPQFIKAAAVSRCIRDHMATDGSPIEEILVHTGQHFDRNMSEVFFAQLQIPEPDFNLGIANCGHGAMTGRMLEGIEEILLAEKPDRLLIYGDTNSTLAGAIAAAKLHIPVSHVEAGLRSFNMRMPEEINRILSDRVSDQLFCPTSTAVANLRSEGITEGVHDVGDVMYDIALFYADRARAEISLDTWGLPERGYALCTVHRAENTDHEGRLEAILSALREISVDIPVILPLHPRTRHLLERTGRSALLDGLRVVEPVSYLEMVRLELSARVILTDSGGVQKEAFFHRVPCLTLRDETEWVETVQLGWNRLCGANREVILSAWRDVDSVSRQVAAPYGDGHAAERIRDLLAAG